MLDGSEKGTFRNPVTGDESWFTLQFRHSAKSAVLQDVMPQKVRQRIGISKFMLAVMRGIDGFHVVNFMTSQERFNSQYLVDNVLTHTLPKIFPQGRRRHALPLHCHLDNCRVHFSKASEQFFTEDEIVHLPHPRYSPDLAPSDFWLFGHMKAALAGPALDRPEELLDAITTFLEEVQVSELKGVFQH
jgi:histone-lysine N-methyltransferase SETMAR